MTESALAPGGYGIMIIIGRDDNRSAADGTALARPARPTPQ
jgi:hypothetical protein